MTVRAVIFDIDGTLIDTNEAHIDAWREAFAAHGYSVTAERIKPETGKGGDQLVPAILGDDGEKRDGDAIRQEHADAFLHIAKRRHFRVFPGVQELLDAVRRRGLKTALATSSKKKFVEATEKSAHFDLESLVDRLVTADDIEQSKPAPDLVLATLHKLDLPAAACLFVGDTAYDAEAARKAGVASVGLLCGGCSSDEALRAGGACCVWRDPADLLHHLDQVLADSCAAEQGVRG